jgi:hypothetical protein
VGRLDEVFMVVVEGETSVGFGDLAREGDQGQKEDRGRPGKGNVGTRHHCGRRERMEAQHIQHVCTAERMLRFDRRDWRTSREAKPFKPAEHQQRELCFFALL